MAAWSRASSGSGPGRCAKSSGTSSSGPSERARAHQAAPELCGTGDGFLGLLSYGTTAALAAIGPVDLGAEENLIVPMIHGAAEFDDAVGRGGEKSVEDFKREMGTPMYALEKLMSSMRGVINPENREL